MDVQQVNFEFTEFSAQVLPAGKPIENPCDAAQPVPTAQCDRWKDTLTNGMVYTEFFSVHVLSCLKFV